MSNLCLKGLHKERNKDHNVIHVFLPLLFKQDLIERYFVLMPVADSWVSKLCSATYPLGQWVLYIFGSKTDCGFFLYFENLM